VSAPLGALDPHHDGSPLYRPDPPVLGARIPLRVRVPHTAEGRPAADHVVLRSVRDGEPYVVEATQESSDEAGAWWTVDLPVHNPSTSYRFLLTDGRSRFRWLNAAGVHERDVTDASDFRISTKHLLPDWVEDQVAYQVFPDRFQRTETGAPLPAWAIPAAWDDPVLHRGPDVPFQLYGGTLDGIGERLGHLGDLGTTLLYLTPVFEAWSNHRYDAVSFDRVDPVLGGDAALSRLLHAAHQAGIRVVGDLTTNHTGAHHDWFEAARADAGSAERGFYRFGDDDTYVSWLDIASLPKLDHSDVELARRLYDGPDSVVARWLREGLDGWRVDVANMTGRLGADDLAHQVAQAVRRTIADVRPDGWLLAEHGHDASLDLDGTGWHGTMDYAGFTRPVWCWLNGGSPTHPVEPPGLPHGLSYLGLPIDIPVVPAELAVATMREVHAAMPWQSYVGSTMHLDSHDVPRFRTVTGGGTDGWIDAKGRGRDRHLVGLAIQMTMPGVPVVFMGDEIGLTGLDGEHARTPFPWDRREEWDQATLDAYRTWIGVRREHVALRRGGLRWLAASGDSMTYLREHPEQTVLVHVTRAATSPTEIPLAVLGPDVRGCTAVAGAEPVIRGDVLVLPGDGPAALAAVVG
jgi:alpha-glucosidase